jgi:DNA processing protein
MDDPERLHCAAWARVPGIGPAWALALFHAFGGWEAAWRAPAVDLAAIRLLDAAGRPGARRLGDDAARAAAAGRAQLDPQALAAGDRALGGRFVMATDPDYPAALRDLAVPPPALWVRGAWPLPERAIALVGARQASPYGLRQARRLGHDLAAAGVAVVSGAAAGVDRAAHEGAMAAPGGVTVAVLGCGLGHIYPAAHRKLYADIADGGGTLLTEFPPETPPIAGQFPRRNRLIAALAAGVVVVEARVRSGSLITASFAAELGRELLAVPGPVDHPGAEGPNQLLRDGAALVAGAADVFAALAWARPAAPPTRAQLGPDEARVMKALLDADADGGLTLDALLVRTGLTPGAAAGVLVGLQLRDLAAMQPGARWTLA